jgi:hypothetical protein
LKASPLWRAAGRASKGDDRSASVVVCGAPPAPIALAPRLQLRPHDDRQVEPNRPAVPAAGVPRRQPCGVAALVALALGPAATASTRLGAAARALSE